MNAIEKIRSKFAKRIAVTPIEPIIEHSEFIKSLNDITIYKFIKCQCVHDLSLLVIFGSPSEYDLHAAWMNIYEQFLDAIRDKDGAYKIRLLSQINTLEFKYQLFQLCIKRLTAGPSQAALDALRQHIRVPGQFNPEDQKQYFNDLQVAINRSQRLLADIEEKKKEYEILTQGETPDSKEITEDHYDDLIANVAIYTHFHIDKRLMFMGDFLSYYRAMRHSNEIINQQLSKK